MRRPRGPTCFQLSCTYLCLVLDFSWHPSPRLDPWITRALRSALIRPPPCEFCISCLQPSCFIPKTKVQFIAIIYRVAFCQVLSPCSAPDVLKYKNFPCKELFGFHSIFSKKRLVLIENESRAVAPLIKYTGLQPLILKIYKGSFCFWAQQDFQHHSRTT